MDVNFNVDSVNFTVNTLVTDSDGNSITGKEVGTVVRSLGLYADEDELEVMADKLRTPEFLAWIEKKFKEQISNKEVMDERMTRWVIEGLSDDIADPKWTKGQIGFLKMQLAWQQKQLAGNRKLQERIKILEAKTKEKQTDVPATVAPVEQLSSAVYDRLSVAWKEKYEGTEVLDYLLKSLDEYDEQWKKGGPYAAPWTCIIQSSGWGKSRSICELSTKGVYVIYISFSEKGIPHGTPGAKTYFTGVQNSVRKIGAAFVECLYHLSSEMAKDQSPEQLVARQTSKGQNLWNAYDWGRGEREVSQLQKCKYMDVTLDYWDDVELKAWMEMKMMDLQNRFGGRVRRTGLKVLFCLDEAGELFELEPKLFMVMRRAFSCFPQTAGIFAVLLDTSAKLRMLAPTRTVNPSLKGSLPETQVFAPLCIAGVVRFNSNDLRSKKCGLSGSVDTSRVLFSAGRPLWAACLLDKNAVTTKEAITYAIQKLLGGISLSDVLKKKTLEESMAIGILSASIGLEVVAWSELAQTLVASHMRTALVVSPERDRIFTGDVVEPILGEAAARILVNKDLLLKVLETLDGVCKQAFVLEVPRGELIGRIILTLAMYDCQLSDRGYSQPVPLDKFLTKVCGKEVECAKGNVFFNRCCVVSGDLTPEILLKCYLGCFAVIPRRNQEGFDFLIPVLYARSDGEFELSEANMGAIPCQFRDRDSYSINSALLVSWAKHFSFSGYVINERKRQRLEGNFDNDDSGEVLQQAEEMMQSPKHAEEYFRLLECEPPMDEMYAENVEQLQDQIMAARKKYSRENKERRQECSTRNKDEGKQEAEVPTQGRENHIELSKAIGLYFHLNSPTKSKNKWVMHIEETVILHGLRIYSFLKDDVVKKLEGLRTAYHKLETMVKSEEELECLKRLVWPYFGRVKGNVSS